MEHLIEFIATKKDAELLENQRKAWLQLCSDKKAEYSVKFPIIQTLDDSLQKFQDSSYEDSFKNWIILWVEDRVMSLCSDNVKFSDDETKAFINNFGWYNNVITMLLANQKLLQNELFEIKNTETNMKLSPVMSDVELITDLFKMCDKTFGRTIKEVATYKKRLANYNRLKKAYDKFMKSTKEYADDIHPKDRHQIGDLMFIEPELSKMMKTFEEDIISTKPNIPEAFSNKRRNTNRALTIAVIKMINKHAENIIKQTAKPAFINSTIFY